MENGSRIRVSYVDYWSFGIGSRGEATMPADKTLRSADISVPRLPPSRWILGMEETEMRNRLMTHLIAGGLLAGWLSVSASAAAIFVRVAPPRPIVERFTVRPGPSYVWIGGYYRWSGQLYVWVPGRWTYPP